MTSRDQRLRGPTRTLLAMDQRTIADIIKRALGHTSYITQVVSTLQDATAAIVNWKPHLIVVDTDGPGDGLLAWLSRPGRNGDPPAIVAITARSDLPSKLAAFHRGVDDILTVPFSTEEFVARVVAIMRRTYRDALAFTPVLRLGDLEIDVLSRRVRVGDSELHLTSLEHSLLYLLAANAGRLLSRDEILDYLWGPDYVARSNVVDRHIYNLRLKLQNHSRRARYIATVSGRGYKFLPDATVHPPSVSR